VGDGLRSTANVVRRPDGEGYKSSTGGCTKTASGVVSSESVDLDAMGLLLEEDALVLEEKAGSRRKEEGSRIETIE
jgi:hypothetical protein